MITKATPRASVMTVRLWQAVLSEGVIVLKICSETAVSAQT